MHKLHETCFSQTGWLLQAQDQCKKFWPGRKLAKNASVPVWQGLGTSNNCISTVVDNLVRTPAKKNNNYWSPLSCLVEEKEDKEVEHTNANHLLSAVTVLQSPRLQNTIAAKWKRKLKNRSGILNTGCTSGANAEHDVDCFHNTGCLSKKAFMLPDKTKIKATNKMWRKHNLWPKASK